MVYKNPNYEEDSRIANEKFAIERQKEIEAAQKILSSKLSRAADVLNDLVTVDALDDDYGRGANIRFKAASTLLKGHGLLVEKVEHSGRLPIEIFLPEQDGGTKKE